MESDVVDDCHDSERDAVDDRHDGESQEGSNDKPYQHESSQAAGVIAVC
jgi:hypothetical protein